MTFTFENRLLWLGLWSVALIGCGSNETTAIADKKIATEAAPVAELAAELESAGALLTRDEKSGRIIGVDCTKVEVTDELAERLSALTACTKLTLPKSAMSDAGWASLAGLAALQQLDLRECTINNTQLAAAVGGMPELRALRLSGKEGRTNVDDDGLAVLAKCPNLKVLAADELWISEVGLKHLAGCKQMSELYLKGTLVEDQAMSLIAEMKNLRKLRLAKTGVGVPGLEQLAALSLEELDISECSRVVDDAMVPVGKMRTLKRLNLWRDVVTDDGVAQIKDLSNMEWLNLDNTHVRDAGLDHLSRMTKLTFLHIGSTGVSDAGMSKLAPLQALKDLKVTRTSVTDAGAASVSKAIPGVSVQLKYVEGE